MTKRLFFLLVLFGWWNPVLVLLGLSSLTIVSFSERTRSKKESKLQNLGTRHNSVHNNKAQWEVFNPIYEYIHSCFIFIYACVYYCVNQVCRISGDLVHFSPDFRMISRNPRPFGHATVFRIAGRHNVFVMCISFLKNLFLSHRHDHKKEKKKRIEYEGAGAALRSLAICCIANKIALLPALSFFMKSFQIGERVFRKKKQQ